MSFGLGQIFPKAGGDWQERHTVAGSLGFRGAYWLGKCEPRLVPALPVVTSAPVLSCVPSVVQMGKRGGLIEGNLGKTASGVSKRICFQYGKHLHWEYEGDLGVVTFGRDRQRI